MDSSFTFKPDVHYVVDLNAALNFPEFFDADADLPQRHLIISSIYQGNLHKMRDENSDRGVAAGELAILLYRIITDGKSIKADGAQQYTLGNLSVIIDYQKHEYSGKGAISGENIKDTLALAEYWSKQPITNGNVVILTNDPIMQISAQDKPHLKIHMFSPAPYIGYRRVSGDEIILAWRKANRMSADTFYSILPDAEPLKPHEFVMFGKTNTFNHIGRYDARRGEIVPLTYYKQLKCITPIGELQAMAIEALMAPASEISVVILYGNAGAGKTFAATAAALAQTNLVTAKYANVYSGPEDFKGNGRKGRRNNQHTSSYEEVMICDDDGVDYPYQGIMICPPDRMLGDKMAAVPGDERAKLASKLNAYLDNIRAYLRIRRDKMEGGREMTERDIAHRAESILNRIELCPPGEINGRSFWDTFFICDEAQFNSLAQIKACIERCDSGTKLALCGDPSQISNPFGWHGNPLARAVRYLGSDPNVAIIRFDGESEIMRPGAKIIARSWPR